MKKVIITVCVAFVAAAAAQAQGLGTVRDINSFGTEYMKAPASTHKRVERKENTQKDAFSKAFEKQVLKKQREMYAQVNTEKAWQGDYHGTQTAATQKQAAKPTKKADSKAATKEAQPSKRSEQQNEQANKPAKKEKGSWWGALFGGRYPGESDESFRFRLEMRTYPAAQPFK